MQQPVRDDFALLSQAGPTEEILSSMFYNLFLDDEVRPQFSRYDALAVLSWDDLNADDNLLASLYGAASTGASTFWVKSVVAGSGNGNSDDTGSSNDTANGSDADNGNGTGNNIGNDIGNDAGNSDDISTGNDTGDGKGKHAIGKKTSTAVDRSIISHDVYNNNNPGFAEYVGLIYERWALLLPYKKALELTLCPPAYACYSNMFVVYDEQVSESDIFASFGITDGIFIHTRAGGMDVSVLILDSTASAPSLLKRRGIYALPGIGGVEPDRARCLLVRRQYHTLICRLFMTGYVWKTEAGSPNIWPHAHGLTWD